ncbi:hypothetical protein KsCSTR_11050 [Candidatus Kuenenia stuttgartiensis]|jgi:hypothetical protein|uniref:Uncharacterized protein n=1 Tax=Kuenenia stuttgartiensis TaxID=174633 RepID=Q1PYK8_KUEST|nr:MULTISPECIES: hypothetical protein [Kuenenia]MBE7547548.1 hypothetical protein [Planctomycetia bacterium]MBZ0193261.1 hypothetical protein [Candidatus Kuenenia stuttgartiensis]MCL4726568.1 hypothetical protein [Candidatus Kuenenia stuttgartiensis]MCR4293390.1 hypothetical protein [Candidatus Kuenenia sp.]MCZ7624296.1 hypothetical protein [Candidatus Kuenenia sp.]
MYNDPIIEEIHKYREKHAAKFNYDIKKIVDYYRKRQNESSKKIVSFIKKADEIHTEN